MCLLQGQNTKFLAKRLCEECSHSFHPSTLNTELNGLTKISCLRKSEEMCPNFVLQYKRIDYICIELTYIIIRSLRHQSSNPTYCIYSDIP